MLIGLSILLGLILVLAGVLLWLSPGKIKPVSGPDGRPIPGSLSEKTWVEINSVQQGMVLQSRDPASPVLLFMHGGPGMPEYFLTDRYPTGLEQDFTVAW